MNQLICLDIETGSADPNTCQLLEIACVTIDPIALRPIPESEFVTLVRPEDESTLEPSAMAVNRIPIEELREAPPAKIALQKFHEHINRFYSGRTKSSFKAPYPAGKNIKYFDIPVLTRYCQRFKLVSDDGEPKMFNRKWMYDIEDDLFRWFGQTNLWPDLSMDTAREYFGMPKEDAHRGLTDVRQTAWLICKFLKFYRTSVGKVPFKNSASEGLNYV